MLITASHGGAGVPVDVDETCCTLSALKRLLSVALPDVDVEKVCLEVDGRPVDSDDGVVALAEGSRLEISPTLAACAAATLRAEGHAVDAEGFYEAIQSGELRICGLYLDAGVEWDFEAGNSPLHYACTQGHVQICKLLINRGADVDGHNPHGLTALHAALHAAVSFQNLEVCELLLDLGCDAEAKSGGETPLHLASAIDNLAACELLLERSCAIDAKDEDDRTPLHCAVGNAALSVCTLLLDRGCNVNARSCTGDTPLHEAVTLAADLETAELLIDRGADVFAHNNAEKTPLTSGGGRPEVYALLRRVVNAAPHV